MRFYTKENKKRAEEIYQKAIASQNPYPYGRWRKTDGSGSQVNVKSKPVQYIGDVYEAVNDDTLYPYRIAVTIDGLLEEGYKWLGA